MNKASYVAALRELADYVEQRDFPDIKDCGWRGIEDSFSPPNLSISVNSKIDFGKFCSAMGTFTKEVSEYSTSAVASLPSTTKVTVWCSRGVVCKRVVVGTRIVAAKEEEVIPAEPEYEEEIVKWECPESFVALAENSEGV